jgi:sulfatase maturation enzyme AslB (radical SAM superfamily)
MNRELLSMVQYIIDNSNATISIDTNGSIRDEEWWWNLGAIGGRRLHVTFAVDGIDQKMHSHYRRNTDLKKVLANMESISQTLSKPRVRTIVFKHNEDYLEQIEEMARSYGASTIEFTPSDRWEKGSVFDFIDEFGNAQKLEQSRILDGYKV